MIWCVLNDTVLHLSFGHYCNIVSGVFICMLTLSAGYYFGNHKFKKDYSYSIYLYHMIVINVLVMFGIKGEYVGYIYYICDHFGILVYFNELCDKGQ